MMGVYQHCKEKHLHRYPANRIRLGIDDVQRTERAIRDVIGKRLTANNSCCPLASALWTRKKRRGLVPQ